MKIIKRDGTTVEFNKQKIIEAVSRAFLEVDKTTEYSETIINQIADEIEMKYSWIANEYQPTVEDIQNDVEGLLVAYQRFDVAKAYILYREKRKMLRDTNKVYDSILELIEFTGISSSFELTSMAAWPSSSPCFCPVPTSSELILGIHPLSLLISHIHMRC